MGTGKCIRDRLAPNLRGVSILQALMIHLTSLLLSKLEQTQTFSYQDHKTMSVQAIVAHLVEMKGKRSYSYVLRFFFNYSKEESPWYSWLKLLLLDSFVWRKVDWTGEDDGSPGIVPQWAWFYELPLGVIMTLPNYCSYSIFLWQT